MEESNTISEEGEDSLIAMNASGSPSKEWFFDNCFIVKPIQSKNKEDVFFDFINSAQIPKHMIPELLA